MTNKFKEQFPGLPDNIIGTTVASTNGMWKEIIQLQCLSKSKVREDLIKHLSGRVPVYLLKELLKELNLEVKK